MCNRSPFTIAWEDCLGTSAPKTRHAVKELFWNGGCFDELELPGLHKAYLGLTGNFECLTRSASRDSLNDKGLNGRTLLSWAAERGDHQNMARLIMLGADPHQADEFGMTPLHFAASFSRLQCVRLLLHQANANPNASTNDGYTPLHYPVGPRTMKVLLENGADPSAKNMYGETPLQYYIRRGRPAACIEAALAVGSSSGLNEIRSAIVWNNNKALKLLTAQKNVWGASWAGSSAVLLDAVEWGSLATLEILATYWPTGLAFDNDADKLCQANELAILRRDFSHQWAQSHLVAPDKNPNAFYQAWQHLITSVEARSRKPTKAISKSKRPDTSWLALTADRNDVIEGHHSAANCIVNATTNQANNEYSRDHKSQTTEDSIIEIIDEEDDQSEVWEDAKETL